MRWAITLYVESSSESEVREFAEELVEEALCGHMSVESSADVRSA